MIDKDGDEDDDGAPPRLQRDPVRSGARGGSAARGTGHLRLVWGFDFVRLFISFRWVSCIGLFGCGEKM
jgi:hypothetical protein